MNITPNWTALITFALVWVLVFILTKVFFKPVGRVLDERASRIAVDTEAARAALEAYEQDLKRVEDRLKEARSASDEIWAKAEIEALKRKSRLIQEIQSESHAQVEKAKEELSREIERLKRDLDARTEDMAEAIERRLLN
jgi:F-type H+-transporting ATPase subunit b